MNLKITETLYKRLEKHCSGFNDTPARVIERILDHYEGKEPSNNEPIPTVFSPSLDVKDFSKLFFNGQSYGKSRLVLAVVQQYVLDHPETSFQELELAFPKHLQGSIGVVNPYHEVLEKYHGKSDARHFIKEKDVVRLSEGDVVVSTQWGVGNIVAFIQAAVLHGYEVNS